MNRTRNLWIALGVVLLGSFSVLGFFGREVYRQAPPIPERVVSESGAALFTKAEILDGQQVWQSIGGQQIGSIWGHGAYQAPDWSADWLHREATALLDIWAMREKAMSYEKLDVEEQGGLKARLVGEMRTNRYDAATGTLTVSADRAEAMTRTAAHYLALFGDDPALASLREDYSLARNAIPDVERRAKMMNFFFWTSWAAAAERPGSAVTYTNNWPHEELVGNRPTGSNLIWSMVSVLLLLIGIAALVWHRARQSEGDEGLVAPAKDPLESWTITPSMKIAGLFCLVSTTLFIVQVVLGALTAHYTVEGNAFFGYDLSEILPYAVTRTWHVQTGVFWIATAFLAAGLFLAPAVGGREPKGQALGVGALLAALFLVVGGSLTGEWLSVKQRLSQDVSFWWGHQGYEYVDLGRAWQIALWGGLFLWLFLMLRALAPALRQRDTSRTITLLFAGATAAIGLFYGAGLLFGARTHLSVMEYWRWWVVHLWVEGFMEVFATAAIAFIFAKMGLVRPASAGRAALFSTCIFLVAGIPGTFHHLYFSGTPVSIMAIGSSFSALEVVPLVFVGYEAWQTLKTQSFAPWMRRYRWPVRFFVGTAFWNFVGAGVFGFLINPPIALYYMQGLNTTPVHGHTALFGVYGLLAMGLMLVVLRHARSRAPWKEGALKFSFWAMNIGLGLMVLLSLLPIGLAQTWASVDVGLWYARSAEFLQQPALETLRWLRIVGDTIFLAGAFAFAWFVIGLFTGHSFVVEKLPDGRLGAADRTPKGAGVLSK